jgi:hypothetical protein
MNIEVGMPATLEFFMSLIPAVVADVTETDGEVTSVVLREVDSDNEHEFSREESGEFGQPFYRVYEFGVQHSFNALTELSDEGPLYLEDKSE